MEPIEVQELLDHLVTVINQSYKKTRPPDGISNSRGGKSDEKQKVRHLTLFYQWPLALLTDEKADEIWDWLRKWPIHPGEFDWGVDWRVIKAERIECSTCKGKGSWEDLDGRDHDHLHIDRCSYCGGRGYQNRAKRGAKV